MKSPRSQNMYPVHHDDCYRFFNFGCFKFHRLCILHAVLSILCLQSSIAQNKSCHVYNDHGGVVNITDSQTSPQIQVYNRRLDEGLFCKAENFCQIEWLKNGIPMEGFEHPRNFTSDVQENWMLKPPMPDNNQTLAFDKLYCDAEGEWTCVVLGESGIQVTCTMEIAITEVPLEGNPVFEAHNNCENMEAEFGDEIRLFCPCRVNNASHDVVLEWFKWVNDTETGVKTYRVSDEKEEEGLGVGEWVPVTNGTSFTLLPPELKFRLITETALTCQSGRK